MSRHALIQLNFISQCNTQIFVEIHKYLARVGVFMKHLREKYSIDKTNDSSYMCIFVKFVYNEDIVQTLKIW